MTGSFGKIVDGKILDIADKRIFVPVSGSSTAFLGFLILGMLYLVGWQEN